MKTRVWLLPWLLWSVSGCAIGPEYVRPEVAVAATWRDAQADQMTAPPQSLDRWWTLFRDPVLDQLVERAVAGNLDLRIAAARIREARAARGIAAAAALPQVDAAAGYARTRRSESVPPFKDSADGKSPFGARDQNLFEAGFDASWEIDVFGGVRRDKEAALAQLQATEEARRDVLVTLVADVARTYVELRGAQRQLTILDETLRTEQDTLGLVTARANAGLATDLDVAKAEGLVATTASQRPVLVRQSGEAVHRLGVLLGAGPDALADQLAPAVAIPLSPPELPAVLPSELLSRRPDVRQAERELAAATARIGVARADLFPRFAIPGSFGHLSDESGDLPSLRSQFWSVIPGLRWPILSGGRIRANIRVQGARHEQAQQTYEKTIVTALQDVADALLARSRELDRQASLRTAIVANRRALEVSLARYTSGVESFLSVLDAQRLLYAADDALAQSERNLAVSAIAVYKSLGGGWSPQSGS
jgi:NodT family efflux transporter outer membrane factor (OMF) lipoprotein